MAFFQISSSKVFQPPQTKRHLSTSIGCSLNALRLSIPKIVLMEEIVLKNHWDVEKTRNKWWKNYSISTKPSRSIQIWPFFHECPTIFPWFLWILCVYPIDFELELEQKDSPKRTELFHRKAWWGHRKQTIRETDEQRETRPLHGIPLNPGWFIRSLVVVLGLWPNSTNFMEHFDLMDPWDDFIWYVYLCMNGWLIFGGEIFW